MPGLALWKGFLNPTFWVQCGILGQAPCCSVPLLNGTDIINFSGVAPLIHGSDSGIIQVRSDYALWCTKHCGFVQKADVQYSTGLVAVNNLF